MTDFPARLYVVVARDEDGSERLVPGVSAEDWSHTEFAHHQIGVYELVSVGRHETRFVEERHALEHLVLNDGEVSR